MGADGGGIRFPISTFSSAINVCTIRTRLFTTARCKLVPNIRQSSASQDALARSFHRLLTSQLPTRDARSTIEAGVRIDRVRVHHCSPKPT
ncbi:unnamed protein product [Danaus chrysippus]|uniref:(African queen) hypothetical protein n=1 Tax=Danaus chrysippus TaxID=151541 RepID=A0A8J2R1G5_9NEOP|nr:unnamed protein product [Danaus chrysippus]